MAGEITCEEENISGSLFDQINDVGSSVNVLIGSRKFMEGWDSFRVSSMGLMNIGKGEGSQIIQLFGRGVRLWGEDYSLKRSSELVSNGAPKNIQFLEISNEGKSRTIINFHGLMWPTATKGDNAERLQQSKNIRAFWDQTPGGKILCGDFNLDSNTQSLAILTESNRDLINEFDVTSTRSSYYQGSNKFADYTIVTPDIVVTDFKVLADQVSDHLAMCLEFE